MRLIYILSFLLLMGFVTSAQTNVTIATPPAWVTEISVLDKEVDEGSGGHQYILIDIQDNLAKETIYRHYAVKVLNPEGVQTMSDIDVTFDPSYQQLTFHQIRIIRGDQVINKLQQRDIKTYQRETNMERSLYDGSLSAVVNLTDVGENDIIEYAYSIEGFNPINKGNYANTFYHQYTVPVNRIYNRILAQAKIHYKKFNQATDPAIKNTNGLTEYIWDTKALDFLLYDNNIPAWYDPHRKVSVSTFNSWKNVVDWALPLYSFSEKEIAKIHQIAESSYSKEGTILQLIRSVQDEIRYLGFESGISAYKPHSPQKVYHQKYGDCKDKSLLLVALLRGEDVEAYPMLVNTLLKDEIEYDLPSANKFDHCVVNFRYEGKDYFVDPTISNQGGDLNRMSFPNYKKGLIIKPGNAVLTTLPETEKPSINIKEVISVESIGGNAGLMVRTEYTHAKADYIRSFFASNATDYIQKEYLNYYSSLYPDIEQADEIKIYDYDRNSANKVIVEEYYHIKNFWLEADDQSYIYCEAYPLVLESQIGYSKSANRNMPYYMGSPYKFSQITQVDLPEEWAIAKTESRISGDGFKYENLMHNVGNTVSVSHFYELDKEYIAGDSVDTMLKKHKDIQNELPYYLTYNASLTGFRLSWVSILIVMVAVGLGIFFSIRVYKNYDPEPWKFAENKSIGSWLILPAIGLTLSPLLLISDFVNGDFFNQNTWEGILSPEIGRSFDLILLVGAEIAFNSFLIVFTLLLIILFYQRRTSIPRLISIYYLVVLISPIIDLVLVEQIAPELLSEADTQATYKEMGRSFVAAAIWVPYFNISERVKSTFCKRFRRSE